MQRTTLVCLGLTILLGACSDDAAGSAADGSTGVAMGGTTTPTADVPTTGGAATSEATTDGSASGSATSDESGSVALDLPAGGLCGADLTACVPLAPPGWDGPFVLFDGPAGDAPACPASAPEMTFTAVADLVPPTPAQCDACSCGEPQGGTCGSVPLTAFQMQQPGPCGGCSTDYLLPPSGCVENILACGSNLGSITMSAASATGGSCTPSIPGANVPPLEWTRALVGCAGMSPAIGCGPDDACIPQDSSFLPGGCVMQAGDHDCPGPAYTDKHLAFLGATDDRGCGACDCTPAEGATCTGKVILHDGPQCAQVIVDGYGIPSDCTWKSVYTSLSVHLDPPQGGACTPGGGNPTGSASPSEPVTICCAAPIPPTPPG